MGSTARHRSKLDVGIIKETGIYVEVAQDSQKYTLTKEGKCKYLECIFINSEENKKCNNLKTRLKD